MNLSFLVSNSHNIIFLTHFLQIDLEKNKYIELNSGAFSLFPAHKTKITGIHYIAPMGDTVGVKNTALA